MLHGMIVLWSGAIADIPNGWAFCDGNDGTPDLRDRFVVGAKQDDAGVPKTNITGALTQSGGTTQHRHNLTAIPGTSGAIDTTESLLTDYEDHIPPYFALAYIMKT